MRKQKLKKIKKPILFRRIYFVLRNNLEQRETEQRYDSTILNDLVAKKEIKRLTEETILKEAPEFIDTIQIKFIKSEILINA